MSVESRIDALGVLQIIGYHALGRRTNPLKHPDFCRKARLALSAKHHKNSKMLPRAHNTHSVTLLGGLLETSLLHVRTVVAVVALLQVRWRYSYMYNN